MSKFGWSLPPGCTQQHIDEAMGTDVICQCCGHDAAECICPECPECGEAGNDYCYEIGRLTYTTAQLIGRSRLRIATLEQQLDDEHEALRALEHRELSND